MAFLDRTLRRSLGALLAGLAAATPTAHALLNFDGTRNQLFLFGGVSFTYNTNIFAQAGGDGDYSITAHAGTELKRKAGLIGVNCTAKLDFVRYQTYSDQDSVNPNVSLVLSKETGRTTGSFNISAYRETRSDSAVNIRTSSWNLPMSLNLRYPINQKFYVTSTTEYLRREYEDNTALVNYVDIGEGVDLYYTYTSKLDLLVGYRLRLSETSAYGRADDHWLNVGATGGLFAKLNGTLRFGYQLRNVELGTPDHYDHFNFSAALTWPVLRKLSLTLSGNRDFNTIATGESIDSMSVALNAAYAYSSKLQFSLGVAAGINDFLAATQNKRRDTFFNWNAGLSYQMNAHFQAGASYTYFKNWSATAEGDYESHGISVNIAGRY